MLVKTWNLKHIHGDSARVQCKIHLTWFKLMCFRWVIDLIWPLEKMAENCDTSLYIISLLYVCFHSVSLSITYTIFYVSYFYSASLPIIICNWCLPYTSPSQLPRIHHSFTKIYYGSGFDFECSLQSSEMTILYLLYTSPPKLLGQLWPLVLQPFLMTLAKHY